jgi:plasmid maintenance system antidote protein VapI
MTLDQIRRALADRKITVVARAIGVHPNTIRALINDPEANPTHRVVQALSEYLSGGLSNG